MYIYLFTEQDMDLVSPGTDISITQIKNKTICSDMTEAFSPALPARLV